MARIDVRYLSWKRLAQPKRCLGDGYLRLAGIRGLCEDQQRGFGLEGIPQAESRVAYL